MTYAVRPHSSIRLDATVLSRRSLLLAGAALGLLATPARAQEATPTDDGPRTLESVMGEVTLAATPQRVVAIEWNLVEYVLALGVQPAAIADIDGFNTWVALPVELGPDVADVGLRYEPSLESIAAAKPDLILGTTDRDEQIYDQLTAIAPTLLLPPFPTEEGETPLTNIGETIQTIAVALARETEAEAVIAHMDRALEDARMAIAEAGRADEPFILTQAFTLENVPTLRLFTDQSLFGFTTSELGLENAWKGQPDPWGFNTVTIEALVDAPPETNFFYIVQSDDDIFAAQLAEDPIWQSLPFVQSGRIYALGGDIWTFGGQLSVERLVGKVADLLTDGGL
ncbi:MAG: iron-siderophore ABC transporter substrate-binding protein [Thermomicrobiales bacterium]|nr:iron-siderophore ABC transporter substrate-binding protein [Thermomicrobiales bacterium]